MAQWVFCCPHSAVEKEENYNQLVDPNFGLNISNGPQAACHRLTKRLLGSLINLLLESIQLPSLLFSYNVFYSAIVANIRKKIM